MSISTAFTPTILIIVYLVVILGAIDIYIQVSPCTLRYLARVSHHAHYTYTVEILQLYQQYIHTKRAKPHNAGTPKVKTNRSGSTNRQASG